MRSVLIFGGSGFIGRHLAAELARRGTAHITIADLRKPEYALPVQAQYRLCDLRQPISLELDPTPDLIVNLAAVHRTPGHRDEEYLETNVQGACHVTDYCERWGVEKIWFTSSIAVYGPSESPVTEASPLTPDSTYGRSKLEAERVYRRWAEREAGRRHLVIVRPAAVFGPGENGNFTRLARALGRGYFVYPGRRDTVKGCGYVGDLVNSLFFMDGQSGPVVIYNYAYPSRYTIEDVCNAYVDVAKLHRPKGTVPLPVLMGVASAARVLDRLGVRNGVHPARVLKLYRSTNVVPERLCEAGFRFQTDLVTALQRWYEEEPRGRFV